MAQCSCGGPASGLWTPSGHKDHRALSGSRVARVRGVEPGWTSPSNRRREDRSPRTRTRDLFSFCRFPFHWPGQDPTVSSSQWWWRRSARSRLPAAAPMPRGTLSHSGRPTGDVNTHMESAIGGNLRDEFGDLQDEECDADEQQDHREGRDQSASEWVVLRQSNATPLCRSGVWGQLPFPAVVGDVVASFDSGSAHRHVDRAAVDGNRTALVAGLSPCFLRCEER